MLMTRDDLRVDLTGELDLIAGDQLEAKIAPMLLPGARVTIGLEGVPLADSSGLGALLALNELAEDNDAELVLRHPSPAVRRVLEMTDTIEYFTIAA
jgi:anti-anti-sigma factor